MGKYSDERNIQILVGVLKANGIKNVVVSPGATNISLVVSLVNDGSFKMYSAVDERGAAYMAVGLASESQDPVVITCTGATASRNYLPALTEAFHRKLPIIAVTASQDYSRCGNLFPQYVDRSIQPNDSVRISAQVPVVRSKEDEFTATLLINKAVLETKRHGGGPVLINLATSQGRKFTNSDLSDVRVIKRYTYGDAMPSIPPRAKVAIIVGNHKQFSEKLTKLVDAFCGKYDGIVIVDHSSHYWGKYRILPTISSAQEMYRSDLFKTDLLIHLGEEHGDYYSDWIGPNAKEVWRVSEDGEIRDPFKKLTSVFEMREDFFFSNYAGTEDDTAACRYAFFDAVKKETDEIYRMIPELPFSNIWVAKNIIPRFPSDACLELGVSNTMRSWTFFDFKQETYVLANTGCRGIDGAVPTAIGMSLADPDRLHFAVMGDLTFFYGFNVLGNRHIGKNVRILLINNGCGEEFHLYQHRAYKILDGDHEKINQFVAAGGHTGTKSRDLVRHFAEDIGFEYITASNKDEFNSQIEHFLSPEMEKSMIFEVITDVDEESNALKMIRNLKSDNKGVIKGTLKALIGK